MTLTGSATRRHVESSLSVATDLATTWGAVVVGEDVDQVPL
jgi:hypothetical protein